MKLMTNDKNKNMAKWYADINYIIWYLLYMFQISMI